jgi:hypothetical protein
MRKVAAIAVRSSDAGDGEATGGLLWRLVVAVEPGEEAEHNIDRMLERRIASATVNL